MNWFASSAPRLPPAATRRLAIGLVNNGPDRALKAIEDHFTSLLRTAAGGRGIDILLFTCPEIPRASRPSGQDGDPYGDVRTMFDRRLDALIVTGMEPQARRLTDEPVWNTIRRVADWSEERAVPVIWSCLAAHAAVLHLDGIARVRLPEKLSGLFPCDVVAARGGLTDGMTRQTLSPHSRLHGLPEAELVTKGLEIVARSDEVGADIFLRHGAATSVFFQGHPEYQADTLLAEYRRDIRRYLMGRQPDYPRTPKNYFDAATEAALARLRRETMRGSHDLGRLDDVASLLARASLPRSWRGAATHFYANWLHQIGRDAHRRSHFPQFLSAEPERRVR